MGTKKKTNQTEATSRKLLNGVDLTLKPSSQDLLWKVLKPYVNASIAKLYKRYQNTELGASLNLDEIASLSNIASCKTIQGVWNYHYSTLKEAKEKGEPYVEPWGFVAYFKTCHKNLVLKAIDKANALQRGLPERHFEDGICDASTTDSSYVLNEFLDLVLANGSIQEILEDHNAQGDYLEIIELALLYHAGELEGEEPMEKKLKNTFSPYFQNLTCIREFLSEFKEIILDEISPEFHLDFNTSTPNKIEYTHKFSRDVCFNYTDFKNNKPTNCDVYALVKFETNHFRVFNYINRNKKELLAKYPDSSKHSPWIKVKVASFRVRSNTNTSIPHLKNKYKKQINSVQEEIIQEIEAMKNLILQGRGANSKTKTKRSA